MLLFLRNALYLQVIINSSSNHVSPMVSEILHSHEHTSKNVTTALTFKVVTFVTSITGEKKIMAASILEVQLDFKIVHNERMPWEQD